MRRRRRGRDGTPRAHGKTVREHREVERTRRPTMHEQSLRSAKTLTPRASALRASILALTTLVLAATPLAGCEGPAGQDGAQGVQGPAGEDGNGTNGTNGSNGDAGSDGPQGPQGPPGPAG